MTNSAPDVVRAQFEAYRSGDEATARRLISDRLRFTSPQDDGISKDQFFATCFPTAKYFVQQDIIDLQELGDGRVFLRYRARHRDEPPFSNVEVITVVGGEIVDIRVYFGGPDDTP